MGIQLLKEEQEALEKVKKSLSKDPNNSNLLTRLGALHFVIFSNEIFEVPNILKKAIKFDNQNDEAMFWLAKYFVHYGKDSDLEKAEKYLHMALKINSERSDCLSLLGSIMLYKNKLDLSIEYLKKAKQFSTSWFRPRYKLAQALLNAGKISEAREMAEEGLKFTRAVRLRDELVEEYYNKVVIGNNNELTRDYKTNNKSDWLELLKDINKKIKEEK